MIGAGTGIAPFRAFLLERARLHAMSRPVGRTILVFGCRDPKEDYIYREELEQAVANLPGLRLPQPFRGLSTLARRVGAMCRTLLPLAGRSSVG